MTDLTFEQIKKAVSRGLKDVADRFARNPRATDGSVRSAVPPRATRNGRRRQGKRRPGSP